MVKIVTRIAFALLWSFLLLATNSSSGDFADSFTEDTADVLPEDDEESAEYKYTVKSETTESESSLPESDSLDYFSDSLESYISKVIEPLNSVTLEASLPETNSATLSPTKTLTDVNSTRTVSISITPTELEILDNMYIRAEECGHTSNVQICREKFCTCIFQGKSVNETLMNLGTRDCGEVSYINCHYLLFCVKERVACLRKLSVSLIAAIPSNERPSIVKNKFVPSLSHRKYENTANVPFYGSSISIESERPDNCDGLKDIYGNISLLTPDVNYYDSLLYKECVDYTSHTIKNTMDGVCLPALVSIYVCGPSFASTLKLPDPIKYTPLEKGERRLLLTITARFVGRFDNAEINVSRDPSKYSSVFDVLNERMHLCFRDAIGIDGEFEMAIADNSLLVRYGVGVSESDAWVGDEVTANALNLMLRNTSWLRKPQTVLNVLSGAKRTLHPPIVVYEVNFEPGKAAVSEKICQPDCIAAIAVVIAAGVLVFVVSMVLCYRRPRIYRDVDSVFISEN